MNAEANEQLSVIENMHHARSWLFVPGDRSDRFAKAATSNADVVICDLEDAISERFKSVARANVAAWLHGGGEACVRINAYGTSFCALDVAALAGAPGLLAVMVPKAEEPEVLTELSGIVGPHVLLIALVETARGLHHAYELAAVPGVVRLAFGSIDFALDIGAEGSNLPMLFARSTLVTTSRAAGVAAPLDGVTVDLDDASSVEGDAAAAVSLGFGGKMCIHPSQVDAVNAAFSPSEQEVLRARRILDVVSDDGAQRVDGQMVDKPVVERARMILQRAGTRDVAAARRQ